MKRFSTMTAESAMFVFLSLLFFTPVTAIEAAPSSSNELTRLQSAYDTGLKKLESEQTKSLLNLQCQYTNALASLEKKAQETGRLEQVMVIRKERDRFTTEKAVDDKDISPDIQNLERLQNEYVKALKEMPLGKARDIITLAQQFDKSLAALEQSLTKQGDMAGALEVRNVRDSLTSRPEVSEANAIVAKTDADKPKAPDKPQESSVKTTASATHPSASNKVDKATSSGDDKKRTGKPALYIKQRYLKLYAALLAGDKQNARTFVDPNYLKKEGDGQTDKQLEFIYGFVMLMKQSSNSRVKVDAMRIKVDDKEETASLVPRLWFYGTWHEQPSMYWMQVDGDWYLDIYTDTKKGTNNRNINVGGWSTSLSR